MSVVDESVTVEISAVIRTLAAEAIRDALYSVASGTDLAPDEATLLELYRGSSPQHKTAAVRTLERGQSGDAS